jgi:hypothetical protein
MNPRWEMNPDLFRALLLCALGKMGGSATFTFTPEQVMQFDRDADALDMHIHATTDESGRTTVTLRIIDRIPRAFEREFDSDVLTDRRSDHDRGCHSQYPPRIDRPARG